MSDDTAPSGEAAEHIPLFAAEGDGMPRWVPRLLRQIVVLIVLLFAAFNLFKALRGFLVLLLISLFLATALEPAVAYLSNRGWRRGLATGFIFLIFGATTTLFVVLMVPLIAEQTRRLVTDIPDYAEQASVWLEGLGLGFDAQQVENALRSIDTALGRIAGDLAGRVFGVGTRVVNTIFQGLTILLFTFYLTADAPTLRRALLSVLPRERQIEVLRVIEIAIDKTGGYFYSRALLAAVSGFVTYVVLLVIGVPFALPLGIWVGILSQFVPVFGTYLGGVLPVLIGLLEAPAKGLWVAVFIVIYQQIENYIIAPRITARTMSLHPAIAFGAVIVGATLLGAPGAIMALPVAATIQAFISTYLRRHEVVDSDLLVDPRSRESMYVESIEQSSRRPPPGEPGAGPPDDAPSAE